MINILKKLLIFILLFFCPSFVIAEVDPFNNLEFFSEPPPEGEGQTKPTSDEEDEGNVDENLHPLLRYDLYKYFVKGVVFIDVSENINNKRALAIISARGESDHVVREGDSISKDWPQWTIKEIRLRGIIVQKRDGENLDDDGNPVYLEERIDVRNPSINTSLSGN
jgi:hypothetical protein|tara:strand:+ start:1777 stop:2274 length:498 start_codon:yes stop_codon:yes gene_type:complete